MNVTDDLSKVDLLAERTPAVALGSDILLLGDASRVLHSAARCVLSEFRA